MQENEFEKQVKEMMGEFLVAPSASVWEKVYKRINKKNRRMLPFFLLSLLAITVSGYFIYTAFNHSPVSINKQPVNSLKNKRPETSTNSKSLLNDSNAETANSNLQENTQISDDSVTGSSVQSSRKKNKNIFYFKNNNEEKNKQFLNKVQAYSNKEKQQLTHKIHDTDYAVLKKDSIDLYTINHKKISIQDSIATAVKPLNNNDNLSTVATPDSTLLTSVQTIKKYSAFAKIPAKKYAQSAKKHNWQFGIAAFYGRSNLIENPFNFTKAQPAFYNTVGPNSGTQYNRDSLPIYKSAGAFKIGIIIQKNVSEKNAFISGLHFTHLSAKNNIGAPVDSGFIISAPNNYTSADSVAGYYQPGSSSLFKNTYNFIELPLLFQHAFLQHKNFSLSGSGGISVMQLLSSSSLIYDAGSNVYFKENKLLAKTQFQLSAGLYFQFPISQHNTLFFEPVFGYNLPDILKNSNYNSYHFIQYGLQAGLLFNKKKYLKTKSIN